MADPLLDDLGENDNPLLSSLVQGESARGRKPAGKRGPTRGLPPSNALEVKRVNASAVPVPPIGEPPPRPSSRGGLTVSIVNAHGNPSGDYNRPPDSARSTTSTAISEASTDLVGAFTQLKRQNNWNGNNATSLSEMEKMDKAKLVTLAKKLYSMIETFQMKAEEDNELQLSTSMGGEPHGLSRNGSSFGGSMVFRRRAAGEQNRPSSADSGQSLASVVRAPVVERGKLEKTTTDDGEKKINEYAIVAEIGRGAYGKVKLAVNETTQQSVAIKIMKKSLLKGAEMIVAREIAIMKKLRHANIVSLYEVINDPEAEKMYLIMQYIANGPLYHLNKQDMTTTPIPHEKLVRILRQLVSGLRYLHKRNIIHRDIKPDNILLDIDGKPYLADFGVSEIAKSGSVHSTEGTPVFLSPELFRGDPHIDGAAADVWALGVTIYGAVYGRLPFVGPNYEAVKKLVLQSPPAFPPENPMTSKWKDVLQGLLTKDPANRMTLKDLKAHPIFNELEKGAAKTTLAKTEEVEVTDLEVLNSIRVVHNFSKKEQVKSSKFLLSVRAKIIVHQFVMRIKTKLMKAQIGAGSTSARSAGAGISAIRGMSPHTPSTQAKGVPSQSPQSGSTVPGINALPRVNAAGVGGASPRIGSSEGTRPPADKVIGATTPRLPSLRRMVRK